MAGSEHRATYANETEHGLHSKKEQMENFKSGGVLGKMLHCPSDALSVWFPCAVWAW